MGKSRKRNHSGSVMLRSDGRWRGRVQLGVKGDGTPDIRTVYGKSQNEAQEKIDTLVEQFEQGQLTEGNAQRLTLSEYLDEHWLPAVKPTLRPTTYQRYEQVVRNHLKPLLGATRLPQLQARQIQIALGKLTERGLSPLTVKQTRLVLHRALAYAMRWRYITYNPASVVDTAPVPRVRRPVLSLEEIKALRANDADPLNLMIQVAIATGARQGELLALTWGDLDVDRGLVKIGRSFNSKFGFQAPKNGKSREAVIPDWLMSRLMEIRETAARSAPTDLIFATSNGTPYLCSNLNKMFRRSLQMAGITSVYRFHDMRHTHVTQLLRQGGTNVANISQQVGHYSPAVTHGLYDHGDVNFHEQYRQAVEKLFD